ncbi:hypothetical protein L2U69_00950 [Zavarzinia compransoris]|uniref:hypothetical protein n=1 Tax=Zavarzinia marina TaxID=2911065 RepID=UPI001F3E6984|nr:hypothetical protein [Zavarzinia marina]MCF4164210.1 hypothetical protein [Zavarzinia marina]
MTVMASARSEIYGRIDRPRRIWCVGAVHAEIERLTRLHDDMAARLRQGDRLVYLGNMIGHGPAAADTIDEMLAFRRHFMGLPGMEPWDVVHLRGAQEEMWVKLTQLQFAPNPREVLYWMVGQGVGATLQSYGIDPESGHNHCRDGILAITRWTARIQQAVHDHPGHDEILSGLRRYAVAAEAGLLFVNAGLDTGRPLSEQRDTFWWGAGVGFPIDAEPYGDFHMVVRGYDRTGGGPAMGAHRATIDGGCGFGGKLVAACFLPDGTVEDWIEA